MKSVSPSTDYYKRLIKKLDDQETQIESFQKELDGLKQRAVDQAKELEDKVGHLTVG